MIDEHKLESIFAAVLPLSAQERSTYLDDVCAGNTELRERVEGLLQASVDAGSFFDKPPAGLQPTIATGQGDTVDEGDGEISLEFLTPSDKANCLGTLDQYEAMEVVGRGGMGLVLRAYDTKLNRVVAIKVMAPELAANPMAVKRFLREARAAAAVSHDHVVSIFAIHDDNKPPFIVMEFVEGQSLQEKIDKRALEPKEILRIGMQMARGLSAAHEQGLVHRDIKPANILLENGVERVKLTDFGLARAVDDVSVTQTGQIAGTPQFMSPEQAQGHAIDARSDLFSLGSVLYTMCAGRPPFRADSAVAMLRRVTDDEPRSIREINSDTPDWLEAIIFKLLAKDPDQRFQSAAEVAELLSDHLAHLQHPTTARKPQSVARAASVSGTAGNQGKPDTSAPTNPLPITFALCFVASLSILAFVCAFTLFMSGLSFGLPGWLRLWTQFGGMASLLVSVAVFILADCSERKNSHRSAVTAGLLNLLPLNPLVVIVMPLTVWTLLRLQHPSARTMYEECPAVDHAEDRRRGPLVIATLACLLIAFYAAITIYIQTDYGTIRIEANDPDTTVTVDGESDINVQKPDGGKLTVRAGEHTLHVTQGDLEFQTDSFRIRRGEEVVVSVTLIDGQLGARLKKSDRVIGLQRDEEPRQEFAIRANQGKYWRFTGENKPILVDADDAGSAETFTLEWQNAERTKAYVRTPDGSYVRGVPDRRREQLLAMDERGSSELFDVKWIDRGDQTFCLRTRDGVNVSASSDGHLTTSRSFSKAETFTLVPRNTKSPRDVAPVSRTTTPVRTIDHGDGSSTFACYLPDGTIVSTSQDRATKDCLLYFTPLKSDHATDGISIGSPGASQVDVSSDGRWIAIANRNEHQVQLWDVPTRKRVHIFDTLGPVHGTSLSPNGKSLAAASWDGSAKVWDIESRELIQNLDGYGSIHRVVFSPDGRRIAVSATPSGITDLYDTTTWKKTSGFNNGYAVGKMAFSADRKWIATGGNGLQNNRGETSWWKMWVRVWDADTGEKLMEFRDPRNAMAAVAFSPDSRYLVAVGGNHGGDLNWGGQPYQTEPIRIWDLQLKQLVAEFVGHDDWVRTVEFAPDGKHFITSSKEAKVWDLNSIVNAGRIANSSRVELTEIQRLPSEHMMHSLAFTSDGRLITAGAKGEVYVWNSETGRKLQTLLGHTDIAFQVAVARDSSFVATAGQTGDILLWDLKDYRRIGKLQGHSDDSVTALDISPDGKWIASAGGDRTVRLWSVEQQRELRQFEGQARPVTGLAFSPEAQLLGCGFDNWIHVWNVQTTELVNRMRGKGGMTSLATSTDGQLALTGSTDSTISVWEIASGRELHRIEDQTGRVQEVAFMPDGQHFVSGSEDRTLRIWSVESGHEVGRAETTNHGTHRLAVSPDGKHIASCGGRYFDIAAGRLVYDFDHDIRIWKLRETIGWNSEPSHNLRLRSSQR